MAKLTQRAITEAARALVLSNPGGIRYAEIHRRIATANPETPPNAIHGGIQRPDLQFPDEIERPERGVYRPIEGTRPVAGASTRRSAGESAPAHDALSVAEADYYQPFAEWLVREHQEATVARALGGAGLSGKWGTPDVLGVYKPLPSDFVQFPKEIIAAEIKVDAKSPVVAFGQATAYRLFSTKSYIVLPKRGQEADLDRVEALAVLFGIGLVVFDGPPSAPNFEVEVRAQRLLPDMFYVNEFAHRLSKHNREMFNELFA